MIVGATFSYEGSLTTSSYDQAKTLVIRTLVSGRTVERRIKLAELPAFIEYMEYNDQFSLDGVIYVNLDDKWKKLFIEGLKREAERMEGSA